MDDRIRIANLRIGTPFPGDNAPAVRYYFEAHHGPPSVGSFTLETTGALFSREDFAARAQAAKKAFEKETSFGSFAKKRYRFCGKERDAESPPRREESRLYYYGAWPAAAGAPWTCRFVSVDPLAGDLIDESPFFYAGNSPINLIDHDGLSPEGISDSSSSKGESYTSKIEGINEKSSNPFNEDFTPNQHTIAESEFDGNEKGLELPTNHSLKYETERQSIDVSSPPRKKIWTWFKSLFEKCRSAMRRQPGDLPQIKLIEVRAKTKVRTRNADPIDVSRTWNTPLTLNINVGNANQLRVKFYDKIARDQLLIEDGTSQESNTNIITNDDVYSSNQGPDGKLTHKTQRAKVALPQGQIRIRVLPNINRTGFRKVFTLSLSWQFREERKVTKTYLFGFLPLFWKTRRTSWVPSARNLNSNN